MATGRSKTPRSAKDKRESLTCSLCLDIFTLPKLLPCHHCFCLSCLENLAACHGSSSFPCPQCRSDVTVPSAGVATFQSNFHIREEDLERARNWTLCLTHTKEDLDLYCVDCELTICGKCAITEHVNHKIKDLHKVASQVSRRLEENEHRLQKAVSHMCHMVAADTEELQSLWEKRAAVENVIRQKQAWLKSVVDKCCDRSLASLNSVSQVIEGRLIDDLNSKQSSQDQLLQLQERLQQAVSSGTASQRLAIAKEMREGWGSPQAVSQLTSAERSSVCRPVLSSKITEDAIMSLVRDFFGAVEEMTMDITEPEVEIRKQFCCGEEKDIEVFSVCPEDDGKKVWISFARRGMREDAPSEEFDENGQHIATEKGVTGKLSWKNTDNGIAMYPDIVPGNIATNDKSKKRNMFQMINYVSNRKADIAIVTVTSEDPFRAKETTLFSIDVAPHRTFDVDSSEQHFVVLEEGLRAPGEQRKVRLYRRNQRHAVATYQPPSAACRPTDVCFWWGPGDREMLVVSDEGTDSLHVVGVREGELRFEGYLAPGCPLLVQPTALNTDTRGRLWVALRGGQIITLSAIAQPLGTDSDSSTAAS